MNNYIAENHFVSPLLLVLLLFYGQIGDGQEMPPDIAQVNANQDTLLSQCKHARTAYEFTRTRPTIRP